MLCCFDFSALYLITGFVFCGWLWDVSTLLFSVWVVCVTLLFWFLLAC